MSQVRLTNESWDGHVLTFDSEDIETLETPWDIQAVSESNGSVEQEFTGRSHVLLHFKPGKHARWEDEIQ